MKLYKRGKLIQGVGINDADYNVYKTELIDGKKKQVWSCPYYKKWSDMLRRGYSSKYKVNYTTYEGVTVCEEWLTFSNFKAWMEKQDWEGKHLDKDFLVEGNKVYSPETCVFIEPLVNTFSNSQDSNRGVLPLGVSFSCNKYIAHCSDPLKRNNLYIGRFNTPEEAHQAWKARKHQYSVELANSEHVTDERVRQVLLTKYKGENHDKSHSS